MTVTELISKLAAQGVSTTPEQIDELLGDVTHLNDDDLPGIIEILSEPAGKAKRSKFKAMSRSKSSNLAKSSSSIAKVDPSNLPQVANMTTGEVTEWIDRIEQSKADGEAQDERLIQFLSDLYNHRQQAIELGRGAIAALSQQDQELQQVMGELSSTVSASLKGLSAADTVLSEIGGGAARLGDSFRQRSRLLSRFHAAIGTHSTQSAAEAESAA
ncbi:MAG: hypothetical protein IGS50_12480 [Synechococcales cyanobacterium C42_A2020_086]|jgi:hypothetical protein|nr:hypothetical protein [Synechococcales cyanobacterium C42_A2020_086]